MAPENSKIERLADLTWTLLQTKAGMTLEEIVDQIPNYGAGKKDALRQQFERDKQLLRRDGIEVEVIPSGNQDDYRYRIDPELYYLPDIDLSPKELAALNFSIAAVEVSGLRDVDGLAKIGIDPSASGSRIVDIEVSPAMPTLFQAIMMRAETRFDYRGKKRRLHPISLSFTAGRWYLLAYDPEDDQAKRFRIDRIQGEITNGPRGSGGPPKEYAGAGELPNVPAAADDEEAEEVLVLRAEGQAAWRLERDLGSELVSERDEGGIVLKVPIRSWAQARPWVLSLLDQVEVLGPDSARSSIIEWLASLVDRPDPEAVSVADVVELGPPESPIGPAEPQQTKTERRLQRLFAMLEWLAEVGTVSTAEIAQRFDMTVDEVVAELELAACCGRPPFSPDQLLDIIVDAHSVTARLPEFERARRFTSSEATLLVTAAKTLLAIPGSRPEGALASAVAKLEEALKVPSGIEISIEAPEHLELLRRATEEGRELEVAYAADSSAEVTERTIDPLRCEIHDGQWYVWAWCRSREDIRIFRADRFVSAREVGPQPDGLDRSLAEGHGIAASDDADVALVVLGPASAWVADSIPVLGRHDEADGRIVVALAVLSTRWFSRTMVQAGSSASVISPPELAEVVEAAARRTLRRYDPTV